MSKLGKNKDRGDDDRRIVTGEVLQNFRDLGINPSHEAVQKAVDSAMRSQDSQTLGDSDGTIGLN